MFLPSFSQPGTHFLEDIRLVVDDKLTIPADPPTVTINVLDQLLVGNVTSRPLTVDEIRNLGIQFDESSFQAFSFTIALTTESGVVKYDLPALLPIGGSQEEMLVGSQIPGLKTAQLPGLELPNFGIEPVMLELIDEVPPGVTIPPIPGIVVIPGNIAYLNQFFSVLLSVSNQAPDGTPLTVRDVEAEIVLPPGADGVAGNIVLDPPFAPGQPEFDNPLRVAKTAAGRQNIKPVLAPGPDGQAGTADDMNRLRPQSSGTAEFLVEGVREGGHVVDIEIRGVLDGLPSGPVRVAGHARGAVVVRDPTFSLTFIHPDTIRAGQLYDLTVQIQNTSQVTANLMTVALDAANLSGARLVHPEDGSQLIETLAAGASATVTLRLEALRTGRVTASTLEIASETGTVTGRRLAFRTGVSDQGVPLSPDTLILPPAVSLLRERAQNDDLTFRAVALLGEAHSIATTPRGSLPAGVRPISAGLVTQRARELSEAAFRLELSMREGASGAAEPLPEGLLLTLQDLYLDFLGSGVLDDGWDSLYRQSRQARLFGAALAEVVGRQGSLLGFADLLALQKSWADTESYRPDHLTIMTQSSGATLPVVLELHDSLGRKLGGSLDPESGQRQIPGADVIYFSAPGSPSGQFATLTQLSAAPFTATLMALQAGTFDLGMVVRGSDGQLRQVTFRGLSVVTGDQLRATIRPRQNPAVVLERNGAALTSSSEEVIPDSPPQVLGIVQNADPSVDVFGRVVAVLFDEDVELTSAQTASSYKISDSTIPVIPPPDLVDGNKVQNALAQFGNRIVLLGLRDPIGPFVTRRLDISGIRDLRGQTMLPVTGQRILPDPDIGHGGQLTGRIIRAGGSPVANPEIRYSHGLETDLGQCVETEVTVKPGDADGRYGLDFIAKDTCGSFPFRIRARDPTSGEEGVLRSRVAFDGQRISLDIVLAGRGTVQGTVRNANGTPQSGVSIALTSETDFATYTSATDQNGFYRISRVPVGAAGIEARGAAGSARASALVPGSGSTSTVDVTIFGSAEEVITGLVKTPEGASAPNVEVFLGASDSTGTGTIAATMTDAAGTFRFDRIATGSYQVRALDRGAGLEGDALVTVTGQHTEENPAFVNVVLAGTGSVSGTVLELAGGIAVPVPGALVAGGLQVVTADAEGQYLIPAVPVGQRVIEAASPQTGARGSRLVHILTAGQMSQGIDIVLEPSGRISGRVLSPEGQPLANQEVRILVQEVAGPTGRTFLIRKTQSGPDGVYEFNRLEPKPYTLMAVRGNEVANATVMLSTLVLEQLVDLRLIRPTGSVSGRVVDGSGLAVAAQVRLKARVPNSAGILEFRDAGTITSNPDTGFRFTGVFAGPFALTASSFFAAGTATAAGSLPETNPVAENITLVLANNTGSVRGCVLDPDGNLLSPLAGSSGDPLPLSVFITSRLLRNELAQDPLNPEPDGIRVDASSGCFVSSIPLPADLYTLEVVDDRPGSPTFGLRGQATVSVQQGIEAEQNVRLLGLGAVSVDVVDQSGSPISGVKVVIQRTTFPLDSQEMLASAPTSVTPLVFQGITEGPVSVSALVSTDPGVDVGGRDELRGFGGHTAGFVTPGAVIPVRVVIAGAGVVTGRFLRTDRLTPIPNAQVELTASGRPNLVDSTDADGVFRFEGIPTTSFTLGAFDPTTGRSATTTGSVDADKQVVTRDLILGPIGRVRGVVLDVTRTQPIAGAEVQLSIPHSTTRTVTSQLDGSFIFESIPGGTFTAIAVAANGLSGKATGALDSEGQTVEIEVVLGGSGRIEGVVRDVQGAPVPSAQVTLIGSAGHKTPVQAGSGGGGTGAGFYAFDAVPLGPFTIEARPLGALTPGDGGKATGIIAANGQVVALDVTFQGTITVGATVTGQVGGAPVNVTLDSAGLFGGRLVPTSVQGGVFLFEGVSRAPFTVSATQQTPVGTTISASASVFEPALPAAGTRLVPDLALALDAVATVRGVVTSEGSPVSGAKVTLAAGSFMTVALTGVAGTFEFPGVPTGVALRIDSEGPAGGRSFFTGTVDADAVVRDAAGNAIDQIVQALDSVRPQIVSVNPPSGSPSVPTVTAIMVAFSEPIDPATLRPCSAANSPGPITIRLLESTGLPTQINDPANLCDDSNVVPAAIVLSADGKVVTLTPGRTLRGQVQHVLIVSAAAVDGSGQLTGGVRDLVGLPLTDDFMSHFVTGDDVPPAILTISPANGAVNVPKDALVRVTLSEPIDPAGVNAASFAVNGPSGPVPGQRDLIMGNTVVVFTPVTAAGGRAFFDSNAIYAVAVAGFRDPAGNTQAPPSVTTSFRTLDTIPPVVSPITAPNGAREGDSVLLQATTADSDVASMEFFVDGVLKAKATAPSAPGEYSSTVVMPGKAISVAARAIDTTGNVGALSATVKISLLEDHAPSVSIAEPDAGTIVSPGTTVSFVLNATDDFGVSEIQGIVSGAVTATNVRSISPASTNAAVTIDVAVPADGPAGPLTFAAVAKDTKGQTSAAATVTITVRDDLDPVVSIEAPTAGAVALPGVSLNVSVKGIDAGYVSRLSLQIPEVGFSQTVSIVPAAPSVTRSFVVPLPDPLTPNSLTLQATAQDRSGRNGAAPDRVIPVLKSFAVESAAIRGAPSSAGAASANTGQTVQMTGQGLTNALLIRFNTSADDGTAGTTTSPLFGVNAGGTAGSITVPSVAVTGNIRIETASGTLVPGEALLQIVPTVDTITVPQGQTIAPGVVATLTGSGFREGATTVQFPGAGVVAAGDVTANNTTLTVTIPAGIASGPLHVVTDGGMSNPLPILGAFELAGVAARGTPADTGVASANVGQSIGVTGEGLSASTIAVFTAAGAAGSAANVEVFLTNVNATGTQASVVVPSAAVSGPVHLRLQDGAALTGPVFLQVVPTLDSYELPPGTIFLAGVVLTLKGTGFVAGGTSVNFEGVSPPAAADVSGSGAALLVTIPSGFLSGDVRVTTAGGTSDVLSVQPEAASEYVVVAGSPPDGSADVPVNARVAARLNREADVSSVDQDSIRVTANGVRVAGTVSLSTDRTLITFTPGAALAVTTTYQVNVDGFSDLPGNAVVPFASSFTTSSSADADITGPVVDDITPAPGAVDVPRNTWITVQFNEPVDPTTVSSATLPIVIEGSVEAVEGSYAIDGPVVAFTPASLLPASTRVLVQVNSNAPDTDVVLDLAGNPFRFTDGSGNRTPFVSSFTTGAAVDNTAPLVTAVSPGDGIVQVPVNPEIVVRLSEPVSALSLRDGVLLTVVGGGPVEGRVSFGADSTIVVFAPGTLLTPNTGYQIQVNGLRDRAGNPVVPFTSGFTTGASAGADTTGPLVSSVSPASGATNVPVIAVVTVQFNEAVDPISVSDATIPIRIQASGALVQGNYVVAGGAVTFTPAQALPNNVTITVTVNSNPSNIDVIRDLAGNPFRFSDSGGIVPFVTSFMTTADVTPPSVTSVTPADGAIGVSPGTAVRVEFSEPVNPATVTASTFRLLENTSSSVAPLITNGAFDASADGWTMANIDGSGGWRSSGGNPGGHFILNDAGGVTDPTISQTVTGLIVGRTYRLTGQFTPIYTSFGNPLALSFGAAIDGVLLGELARPPVGIWQDFDFQFTAAANSLTISLSAERNGDDSSYAVDNIALTALPLSGSITVAGDGRSATFTPGIPLKSATTYRVEVSGIADTAGNLMAGSFQSSFTTLDAVTGLLAAFPFDDGANPTADIVGGHNGTLAGATFDTNDVAPVTGNVSSLLFNGAGAHVMAADPAAFSFGAASPMSISLWLKQTAANSVFHIFGKRQDCGPINYQLARDGNLVHFTSGSSQLLLGSDFQLNTWTHVAVTYDGVSTAKIYVNGIESATSSTFVLGAENSDPFRIGTAGTCPSSQTFPGLIDEVLVYGRTLTAAEVAGLAAPVQLDRDADGFPDDVELATGSNPLSPASTPVTVTVITEAVGSIFSVLNTTNGGDAADPSAFIGESVGPIFSVLNTTNLSDSADPSVFIGESVGPVFSVLNTTNLSDSTDPSVFIGESVGPVFSVLNTTNLSDSTDPSVFVGESVGPIFSVLNTTNLSDSTDPSVFIGEAVSPIFSVQNGASSPLILAEGEARSGASDTAQRRDEAPSIRITYPVNGDALVEGQTIDISVDVSGNERSSGIEVIVNGVALGGDRTRPYGLTFTVPAGVRALTFVARAADAAGNVMTSEPLNVSVVPDPLTTVRGRLLDPDGNPLSNTEVMLTLNGLRAEYFDARTPLSALPDLNGRSPDRVGLVSAINIRNPDGLFGNDPFGAEMNPDYAARFSGYLWIGQAGEYTFVLGADEGARLALNGVTIIQMPSGQGELQAYSRTVTLPAGLIPIEVSYYESLGDAELQLSYIPPGGELQVVPPDVLLVEVEQFRAVTGPSGEFVIPNVPARDAAIRMTVGSVGRSANPVPSGVTEFGDVIVRRSQ